MNPLKDLDNWEDDLLRRYPQDSGPKSAKTKQEFRDYDLDENSRVRQFYKVNHERQTYAFVQAKRAEYLRLNRRKMGIWEALEFLNTLVDDSDPDTELSQIEHCLQTAEAIRADGHPTWFVLTGLIHDLGKILCLFGEPQWCVTGDTFAVGCRFAPQIVYSEYFANNADSENPDFQSEYGVYEPQCGLDNVLLSWGHDEYMYNVVKDYLPPQGLAMIRYHSFYPWHKEGAYAHLTSESDGESLKWVNKFNPYDLYSKSDTRPNVDVLRPYYESLIDEFFPKQIAW